MPDRESPLPTIAKIAQQLTDVDGCRHVLRLLAYEVEQYLTASQRTPFDSARLCEAAEMCIVATHSSAAELATLQAQRAFEADRKLKDQPHAYDEANKTYRDALHDLVERLRPAPE